MQLIERRRKLPPEFALLVGEPETIGYGELQSEIGRLIRGANWKTREVPKALAKAGVWVQQDVLGEDSFIRPWMVDIADDHYAIDITRARELLGRKPKHSLRAMLLRMIDALNADPAGWYRANKLNVARVTEQESNAQERAKQIHAGHEEMKAGHMAATAGMGQHML